MNPRIIDVHLTVSADVDVLVFALDSEHPDDYMVNLSSSTSQNELKKVFSKLLQILMEEDITLRLTVAAGYGKVLQKEVCQAYIEDLNRELLQVKEMIKQEIA